MHEFWGPQTNSTEQGCRAPPPTPQTQGGRDLAKVTPLWPFDSAVLTLHSGLPRPSGGPAALRGELTFPWKTG